MKTENIDTAALDNALVGQKNDLIARIDSAEDFDGLEACGKLLTFVQEVWIELGYGYKLKELRDRIKQRAEEMYRDDEAYLSTLRKNARTRKGVIIHLQKLELLRK